MMKQITVVMLNKVGALSEVTEILGRSGINIISISAQGFENNAVVRVLTTDMNTALHDLGKAGYNAIVNDIIVLKLPDRPGELYKITKKMSKEGLNLRAVYIIGKENDRTIVAIDPEDYAKAVRVLEKQ